MTGGRRMLSSLCVSAACEKMINRPLFNFYSFFFEFNGGCITFARKICVNGLNYVFQIDNLLPYTS